MELRAQAASFLMDSVGQGVLPFKTFPGVQGGAEAMGEYRYIANDDHGAASCGDLFQPFQ